MLFMLFYSYFFIFNKPGLGGYLLSSLFRFVHLSGVTSNGWCVAYLPDLPTLQAWRKALTLLF